jgi:putative hydrolase of the HAD superfamily
VKAVFFDAADTLFHLPNGVGWHYARVAGKHGGYLSAEVLERRFRTVWRAMPAAPETDGPRDDGDRGWWLSLLRRVFSDAPETFNLDTCFPELWEEFARPGVWALFPETLDTLRELQGKVRLGIVSNFDARLHRILANLGVADFFEHVIISSEVGADKPSARIFAAACQKFGITPGKVLFVGDDPEADWLGAGRAGMQVFKLKRPGNDLRGVSAILRAGF